MFESVRQESRRTFIKLAKMKNNNERCDFSAAHTIFLSPHPPNPDSVRRCAPEPGEPRGKEV
jgi:hypothetical protein